MNNIILQEQAYVLAKTYAYQHSCYKQLFDNDMDDYIMSLTVHLLSVIDKYDSNKAKFSTFAFKVFNNHIIHIHRALSRQKRTANIISLDDVIYETDILDNNNTDITFTDETDINMINMLYNNICKYLSKEFIAHYAYNKSFADIAKELNVSRQAVAKKVNKEKEFIHTFLTTDILTSNKKRMKDLSKELSSAKLTCRLYNLF